ncbi:MAG: aminopeptidase P family protein [Phycisphaerales bacterium]|nr:aminopeptidase P family protein [Phycisphaerales bacterium]
MGEYIVAEKVDQASRLLSELGIDVWLTFVRETTESGDPVLPLIADHPVTWQSAFLITRRGERIAIVGKYEDEAVRSSGVWRDVRAYVEGIRTPLRAALDELAPASIAVNYSVDDVKADGLSHGMYLLLLEHLEGTPHASRLVSAADVIRRLRGVKSVTECGRLRAAIAATDAIFEAVVSFARPGRTEAAIHAFMHDRVAQGGMATAWDPAGCPIVTTGPDSMVGHGVPSPHLAVRAGGVFHLDFGVRLDGYCSDLQRVWYVPEPDETAAPADVRRAFATVQGAIDAAAAVLRPGVAGWEVDAAARAVVVSAGYPAYEHATGHHVGRAAHDGGGVLGPRWERYGRTPLHPVEAGNVFTLELGVDIPGRGYLGLEEMVLVTSDGIEWLSARQTSLPLLR